MSNTEHEYLTFILDGEEFGVEILRVQEIKVWTPVTEIPNTPNYLKGVINLRGKIVPIVDLRQRFLRTQLEYSATTVVIVLKTISDGHEIVVGIVVDAVSDVYKMEEKDIKSSPNFGSKIDSRFIQGMATISEKIIILLDTDKLLDVEELYSLTDAISAAS
ncbi:MAG: purine-binding chemotaxis protein CheW [Spongiibacteraceae bacterium]|nr:purine-binding chemotaxis protein CheW [Spongiibacteraceae bacterium]